MMAFYPAKPGRRKTVLVADPAPASRELIRIILEHAGHLVIEVSNGPDAVRRAHDIVPDLVVLDLHMPLMNGLEVARILRNDGRLCAIPIVALTASPMRGDRQLAMAAGINSYISKPACPQALREELAQFLGYNIQPITPPEKRSRQLCERSRQVRASSSSASSRVTGRPANALPYSKQ